MINDFTQNSAFLHELSDTLNFAFLPRRSTKLSELHFLFKKYFKVLLNFQRENLKISVSYMPFPQMASPLTLLYIAAIVRCHLVAI